MSILLHIDASARSGSSEHKPHGSHTRRLSARFIRQWCARQPDTEVIYRDVGLAPPAPVSEAWVHAAFTPEARRERWMHEVLRDSDALIDELLRADVIVAGVPMYNFGPPAQFKAYIDNIVRVGRTFGFDRKRPGEPYWPLLDGMGKRLVILSSRGDFGYGEGGRIAERNHVEASIRSAFAYIGVTEMHGAAVEYDEFSDMRLEASLQQAEAEVGALVLQLSAKAPQQASAPA